MFYMRFPKDIAMLIALEIHRYNTRVLNKQYKTLAFLTINNALQVDRTLYNWRNLSRIDGINYRYIIYRNNYTSSGYTPGNYVFTLQK